MPSIWTLKSLVLFLNAGKRKKRERLNGERKSTRSILRGDDDREVVLTDEIWSMVCDYVSPVDLLRMRRVNQQLNRVVSSRLQSLIYFDALRCDAAETDENAETDFHRVGKSRLYVHMDERSVIVVVDERWTSRDVLTTWRAIQFFAPYARCLNVDVSLAELMVAGLSSVKLSRWFAFQAYSNAMAPGQELHMKVNKIQNAKSALFPKLTEFTVRAMPTDVNYFSRLGDYGVSTEALFSNDVIQLVRCMLLEPMTRLERATPPRLRAKRPHHHLRAFKQWVKSAELGEKYAQCYAS